MFAPIFGNPSKYRDKKVKHVRNEFASDAIVCFLQIVRTLNSEEMMAVSPK